jgi:hypothetical protein
MPHPVSLAFTIVPTSTFRTSFHPLTMPRSPTLKTYDRFFLEKLSRSQIQAHAKVCLPSPLVCFLSSCLYRSFIQRHNIKANGKTESIIVQLLGKGILAEEVPISTVGRSTRAGTRRNRINVAKTEGAGTAEQGSEVASIKTQSAMSPALQSKPTSVAFVPQTSESLCILTLGYSDSSHMAFYQKIPVLPVEGPHIRNTALGPNRRWTAAEEGLHILWLRHPKCKQRWFPWGKQTEMSASYAESSRG